MPVDDVEGVGIVAEVLAHLAAVGGQDEPVDDEVLPGGLTTQRRRQNLGGEQGALAKKRG